MKLKNWFKNHDWGGIICVIVIILFIGAIIASIGMIIYCFTTYGNKPIGEIPAWALFWMFKS